MTCYDDMDNILETFRIQTTGFDLWAALVSLDERHKFMIYGGTRSEKGAICCFHSEISDRDSLRDQLLSACQPIAAFYGATLSHRRIERSERKNEEGPFLPAQESELVH